MFLPAKKSLTEQDLGTAAMPLLPQDANIRKEGG